jgi:mono/diheme cytochrome c family protein
VSVTAALGWAFLAVGLVAMFLMLHLWRYPFDKVTRVSAAPRWAMWLHRGLGYVFVAFYVALMWHMLPRLWQYQVEFPARTVVHIVLGFGIGFLLLLKISILRFFRHFEEWMPVLGVSIMLGTVILLGLSLPFFYQERALASRAPGGDAMSAESRSRVATLLPLAGIPDPVDLSALATVESLTAGRQVLLGQCVLCHDLRTILMKPRTPEDWWNVVSRMADKPALFEPLLVDDLQTVTAYLIAISPDLQKSLKRKREDELEPAEPDLALDAAPPEVDLPSVLDARPAPELPLDAAVVADAAPVAAKPAPVPIDMALAKRTFESVCSQCHEISDVDADPPKTSGQASALIQRMITDNDAELSSRQRRLVLAWLVERYVKGKR